jgi:hypothetical protein
MAELCLFSTDLHDPGDFLQVKTQLETVRQTRLFYMQVLEPVEEEPAAIRPALKQKRLMIPRCLPYTMSKAVTRMLWWIRTDAFMFCFVTDHQLLGTVLMAFCEPIPVLSNSPGSGDNIRC